MLTLITLLLLTTAAVAAPAAEARSNTATISHSYDVVAFFRVHSWLRAPRRIDCGQVPWERSCRIARRVFARHFTRIQTFERDRTIENTSNWTRAMRYAQRPFPGTYEWLEAISGRECRACYTTSAFICNHEGSGACGPMQFMSGTFYAHVGDARAYVEAHGYLVDPVVWDWHNNLGQALVAGYMRYTGQDGCHWCL